MSTQKCDTPRVSREECVCCKNAKGVKCNWCDAVLCSACSKEEKHDGEFLCVVCQKDCCNTYAYIYHENEITCWQCHIQGLMTRIKGAGR